MNNAIWSLIRFFLMIFFMVVYFFFYWGALDVWNIVNIWHYISSRNVILWCWVKYLHITIITTANRRLKRHLATISWTIMKIFKGFSKANLKRQFQMRATVFCKAMSNKKEKRKIALIISKSSHMYLLICLIL